MRKLLKGEQKDEQKGDSAEIAQGRKVQERYREGAGQAWRGGNSGLGSPLFRVFLSFCWPSQSPFHHFFYTWKRWKKGEQKGDLKKQSQMQSDASRESGSGTGEGDFLCRSPWWYLLAFHIDPRKPNQNHAPYVMLCVMKAHDISKNLPRCERWGTLNIWLSFFVFCWLMAFAFAFSLILFGTGALTYGEQLTGRVVIQFLQGLRWETVAQKIARNSASKANICCRLHWFITFAGKFSHRRRKDLSRPFSYCGEFGQAS